MCASPARTTDVAIIGAGAIGLAIAWRVAALGLSATIFDDAPGRGASWVAGGMLAPVTEVKYGEQPLLHLNLAARARWPSFSTELESASGISPGYRESGTLLVARDTDDLDALEAMRAFMERLDLKVERLTARDLRDLEPALAPRIRGGIHAPDDHRVDNRALVEALLAACERTGVRIVRERVAGIVRDGTHAVGVRLPDGSSIGAGKTVLASGAWAGGLDGLPAGSIPVRPVKGQILRLKGPPGASLPSRTIRGLDVYVVPREDGGIVVGATAEEQGFDTTATAGGALHLLREAYALLPGITELELVEISAGLRPGSPDNAPLIGAGPLDDLVVATGHYRHGILLIPITADAVASLIETGETPELIADFDARRFEEVSP